MNARRVASYWMSLCDYRRDISSQAQFVKNEVQPKVQGTFLVHSC